MIWITIINCSNMELMLLWTGNCFLLKGFQYGLPITVMLLLKLLMYLFLKCMQNIHFTGTKLKN